MPNNYIKTPYVCIENSIGGLKSILRDFRMSEKNANMLANKFCCNDCYKYCFDNNVSIYSLLQKILSEYLVKTNINSDFLKHLCVHLENNASFILQIIKDNNLDIDLNETIFNKKVLEKFKKYSEIGEYNFNEKKNIAEICSKYCSSIVFNFDQFMIKKLINLNPNIINVNDNFKCVCGGCDNIYYNSLLTDVLFNVSKKENDYFDILEFIINNENSDLNLVDFENKTPLMASIITKNEQSFRLLINTLNEQCSNRNQEFKLNINKKDKYGRSALYFAVLMNRKKAVETLLTKNAKIYGNVNLLIKELKSKKSLDGYDKNIIKLIKNKFNDVTDNFKNNIGKYNPDIERIILTKQNENLNRVLDNMKLNNNSLSI